jgi:hypothetical protein
MYTQQWQQPQQQLSYDPTYVDESLFVAVQPNNPPVHIPVQTHPNMEPYVASISAMLVHEIQASVQRNKNNLRIFLFNQMARNCYSNQDYAELLQLTVNMVLMQLMRQNGQGDPLQIAGGWIPNIVQMRAAANAMMHPILMNYLDAGMQNEAAAGAQAFQNAVGETARFIQQMSRPVQPNFQAPMHGGGFNTGGAIYGGSQGGFNPMQQGMQQGMPINRGAGISGGTGLFSNSSQSTPQLVRNDQVVSAGANAYEEQLNKVMAARRAPAPVAVNQSPNMNPNGLNMGSGFNQPMNQARSAVISEIGTTSYPPANGFKQEPFQGLPQAQKQIEATVVGSNEVVWKPSDSQPYHPAWNPRTQELFYVKSDDGSVIAVLKDKPENAMLNQPMQYDAHQIGRPPLELKPHISSANDEVVNREAPTVKDIEVTLCEKPIFDVCVDSASSVGSIEAAFKGVFDKPNQAYRTLRFLADQITFKSGQDSQETMQKLRDIHAATTLTELHRVMKSMNRPEELGILLRLDKLMTDEVNSCLNNALSLTTRIDSFVMDFADLPQYINSHHGPRISEIWQRQDRVIASDTIELFEGDEARDYAATLSDEIPEDHSAFTGSIAFLVKRVTYTYLPLAAHELNIAIKDKRAALLTDTGHTQLLKLVKDLFVAPYVTEQGYNRHYLVTTDGLRFQVIKGLLVSDAYLIKYIE